MTATTTPPSSSRGIRERRKSVGLTRYALAALVRCSPSYIGQLDAGYAPRRSVIVERVERVLAEAEAQQ